MTDIEPRVCTACDGTGRIEDPRVTLDRWNQRREAFEQSHRYLHCPACRKRCSAKWNSVNSHADTPTVTMHCSHCDHRWEEPRVP